MENAVLKNKWLNNSCAWLAWQGNFIVTMSYSISKICRSGRQNHLLAKESCCWWIYARQA
jgi:hypothetical protein